MKGLTKKISDMTNKWKWMIFGIIFGLVLVIINLFFGRILTDSEIVRKVTGIFMMPSSYLVAQIFSNCTDSLSCILVIFLFHPAAIAFYGILGLIIGIIIDSVKKKRKNKK